ncbi:MAG: family 43 glycosylhydrolase [Clostridia bacterium]|nr:family 43 glycosylhydrolase [Clostridia bacterium]
MKKSAFILLCLCAALCLCLCLAAAAAETTVYLDRESGSDSAAGTKTSPFATLDAAIGACADGGRILLLSDYVLEGEFAEPAHGGKITLSAENGAKLIFSSTGTVHYRLGGETAFEHLTIRLSGFVLFTANFNPITFGEGLTVENGSKWAFVVGGYETPESTSLADGLDPQITICSGDFYKVCGFSRSKGAGTMTYTGTSHIEVYGGSIAEIYGGSLVNHYGGSAVISVSGGKVGKLCTAGDATRQLKGGARVRVYGGSVGAIEVNNTMGDVTVELAGGKVGDVSVTYASDTLKIAESKARSEKTLKLNAALYTKAEIEKFKSGFDRFENIARIYVRAGASGDGSSEAAPCGDLSSALEKLKSYGGVICLDGSVSAAGLGEVKLGGGLTLTGGVLDFGALDRVTFASPVIFSEITLSCKTLSIVNSGSTLTFARGTAVKGDLSLACDGDAATLSIADGAFRTVDAVLTGGSVRTVEITGGAVDCLQVADKALFSFELALSGGTLQALTLADGAVSDECHLRLRGGSVGEISIGAQTAYLLLDLGRCGVGRIGIAAKPGSGQLSYLPETDAELLASVRPYFEQVSDRRCVYLASGGSGDGSSAQSPLGDLNAAVAALGGGGSVVLCGPYIIDAAYTVAPHAYPLTLTAFDGVTDYTRRGATLDLSAKFVLGGETMIEFLTFTARKSGTIYAAGHPLTVGENVDTVLADGNTTYHNLIGGLNTELKNPSTELVITGGHWNIVRAGYNQLGLEASGLSHTLVISGGVFYDYVAGGSRAMTSGTVDMRIFGGTFYGGLYGLYEEAANDKYDLHFDIKLSISGGTFYGIVGPAKRCVTVLHGSYTLEIGGGDFSHATDILGSEIYAGDMTSTLRVKNGVDLYKEESGQTQFTNWLRANNADPFIMYYDNAYYYACTGSTTISLIKVTNIADIKVVKSTVILRPLVGQNLWSPEIHYFAAEDVGAENAGWYMFIAYDDGTTANQRQHVVKCLDGDNLLGRWGDPVTGEVNLPRHVDFVDEPGLNRDQIGGGMSVIEIGGKKYITFISEVGRGTADFHQTVNICQFENPWTIVGHPTVICEPTEPWEMGGYGYSESAGGWYPKVVEGAAAVYGDNGEVYLMYTGSGYWTIYYQLGYLKFLGGDPMDAANWEKHKDSIFSLSEEINGCGHASYITDQFGTKWACYHAYVGKDTSSKRNSFIEPYVADANGVVIGNGSGHPAPLATVYTVPLNPTPAAQKISGFTVSETGGFVKSRTYADSFTDVTADKWFYPYVKTAYEYTLANGTSQTKFSPDSAFTVAQALTAAVNIHKAYFGGEVAKAGEGQAWYVPYVNYCIEKGIIKDGQFDSYDRSITRGEMATVFADILPDGEYTAVRSGSCPDVTPDMTCAAAVAKLFAAGVVGGDAGSGNYRPNDNIVRSEACVIFTRIAAKEYRAK